MAVSGVPGTVNVAHLFTAKGPRMAHKKKRKTKKRQWQRIRSDQVRPGDRLRLLFGFKHDYTWRFVTVSPDFRAGSDLSRVPLANTDLPADLNASVDIWRKTRRKKMRRAWMDTPLSTVPTSEQIRFRVCDLPSDNGWVYAVRVYGGSTSEATPCVRLRLTITDPDKFNVQRRIWK